MIKQITVIILVLFTLCEGNRALGQTKVSNIDLSFQYNLESGIRGKIISSKQDSTAILRINFSVPLDSLKKYTLSYSLVNSIDEENFFIKIFYV